MYAFVDLHKCSLDVQYTADKNTIYQKGEEMVGAYVFVIQHNNKRTMAMTHSFECMKPVQHKMQKKTLKQSYIVNQNKLIQL